MIPGLFQTAILFLPIGNCHLSARMMVVAEWPLLTELGKHLEAIDGTFGFDIVLF